MSVSPHPPTSPHTWRERFRTVLAIAATLAAGIAGGSRRVYPCSFAVDARLFATIMALCRLPERRCVSFRGDARGNSGGGRLHGPAIHRDGCGQAAHAPAVDPRRRVRLHHCRCNWRVDLHAAHGYRPHHRLLCHCPRRRRRDHDAGAAVWRAPRTHHGRTDGQGCAHRGARAASGDLVRGNAVRNPLPVGPVNPWLPVIALSRFQDRSLHSFREPVRPMPGSWRRSSLLRSQPSWLVGRAHARSPADCRPGRDRQRARRAIQTGIHHATVPSALGFMRCCFFAAGSMAGFGAAIAWLGGYPLPTMVLATAPAGIAEMVLTGKVLGLDFAP